MREQIAGLSSITEATRDAARGQLQPIVFGHQWGGAIRGPNEQHELGDGEVAFPYYLSNEGTGRR